MKSRHQIIKLTLLFSSLLLLFSFFASGDEKVGSTGAMGKGVGAGPGLIGKIIDWLSGFLMDGVRWFTGLLLDGLSLNPNIYDWGTGQLTGSYKDISRLAMLIVIPAYMGVIILAGMYLIFVSMDYRRRAHAKQYITRLFFGLVIVTFAPMIYQMILDIEKAMVDSIFTTAFPGGDWNAAMNGVILLLVLLFFPHFLCTVGWIVLLLILLAAIMVYVRYLVVAILGAFFPITIFFYMWDYTKKLGAKLMRWTLIWISIPVLQTLFYVMFLSLLADFQGVLGALLAIVCFAMIIISPLMMTTLMSSLGSYVNAAGGYWGSPKMIAVGQLMMGSGPWALEAAGSFTGFRKAGWDEYQDSRPEVARPGGDVSKPARGVRGVYHGIKDAGGGKLSKGVFSRSGWDGAVDNFLYGGRMGSTSTQQKRGLMESLTGAAKDGLLTAVQPIGKVFTAAGAEKMYVLPPFLKGYARHMGRALGAGIERDKETKEYTEWGKLFPQITKDRDWKLAKAELDVRARDRMRGKGKSDKGYKGPNSVSIFGTYMRRKIAQAPTSMLASHAGVSLALLSSMSLFGGVGIGIAATIGVSKIVKGVDKRRREQMADTTRAAARGPAPGAGGTPGGGPPGGKPGGAPDKGGSGGEGSAGGKPGGGPGAIPSADGKKVLGAYSLLEIDAGVGDVAEVLQTRGSAYDHEVDGLRGKQKALGKNEKMRKLEVLNAEVEHRKDRRQSDIADLEAQTGNSKRDIEKAIKDSAGKPEERVESVKDKLKLGDEHDERLGRMIEDTGEISRVSDEIQNLRDEEIDNPLGEDLGLVNAGDAFDKLQSLDELLGPGKSDLEGLRDEGEYGEMLARAKENGFSSVVDNERWIKADAQFEDGVRGLNRDEKRTMGFDDKLKFAEKATGDKTLGYRHRELASKRNGMLHVKSPNEYAVGAVGKNEEWKAKKRLDEMNLQGTKSKRKAFGIYDDIVSGKYKYPKWKRLRTLAPYLGAGMAVGTVLPVPFLGSAIGLGIGAALGARRLAKERRGKRRVEKPGSSGGGAGPSGGRPPSSGGPRPERPPEPEKPPVAPAHAHESTPNAQPVTEAAAGEPVILAGPQSDGSIIPVGESTGGKYNRLMAVGDQHGELGRFQEIMEAHSGDRFVFHGDYMDRGDQGVAVAEQVFGDGGLIDQGRAVGLLGNHDLFFMAAMQGDTNAYQNWMYNGGDKVLNEVGASDQRGAMNNPRLQRMAEQMGAKGSIYHLENNALFVHAGLPLDQNGDWIPYKGKTGLEGMQEMQKDMSGGNLDFNRWNSGNSPMWAGDTQRNWEWYHALGGLELNGEGKKRFGDVNGAFDATRRDPNLNLQDYWAIGTPKKERALGQLLGELGVERIVHAHIPDRRDNRVNQQYGGRIINVDAGMADAYGGGGGGIIFDGDRVEAYNHKTKSREAIEGA
ncbi:MAG: hypothetical protein V1921_04940 [Candidatus Altiarchaeota archaeon]